jgi:hypothetical protein
VAAGVSARFAEILAKGDSYQVVARLEVLDKFGAVILDSADSTVLNVAGGSISVDGSASFTRSITDLEVVDPTYSLVPLSKDAALSPANNNEYRISVGAMVDGEPEYIPQGVFHLEGARIEDRPEGLTIKLSAYDRARKYSRSRRVTPRRFLASGDPEALSGWLIRDAIIELLQDAFIGTTVIDDAKVVLTTTRLPEQTVMQGDDPWEAAREFAESMGYLLFFDRVGQCRLVQVPDPNDAGLGVTWEYTEGVGGLLGLVRDQSNEGVINGCAVTGMNPSNGEPVRSDMIWDTDEASATYYLGPYGKVPRFIQSDKVRTVAQANEMARAEVNKNKGLVEAVEFDIVPNPAIDPLDTVKLVRLRSGFVAEGIGSEAVIVDAYTVNLSATGGAMTVSCRQRRLS